MITSASSCPGARPAGRRSASHTTRPEWKPRRPAVEAFLQYLRGDEALRAFVKYHSRPVTHEEFDAENRDFARIEMPFAVELFGRDMVRAKK